MKQLTGSIHSKAQRYPEKVIQFGTGNFLRAFTDWMIHRMNEQAGFEGSVAVVQSTPHGAAGAINEQDGLYTLFSQGILEGQPVRRHEVIESVSRAIVVQEQWEEFMKMAENPDLRFVVSNTTEAGIAFNETDQLNSRPQQSFPGKLTALLYARFRHFGGNAEKGLVMLPCELIDQNGAELKAVILRYAEQWSLEPAFTGWLEEANTFCNSLVDRIVPGYPRKDIQAIQQELGYEDRLVVVGEHYHLWAIEGPEWLEKEFPARAAGLNVKVVKDLAPYRMSKVFVLNGAHTALTPVAMLAGIETVKEAVTNPATKAFIEQLIFQEIIPALDVPKKETVAFAREVLDRFANPFIDHYVKSIALNAMPKFKTRNLPMLRKHTEKFNEVPERIAFALAAWIHVYKESETDEPDVVEFFQSAWGRCDKTDRALEQLTEQVLAFQPLWGQNVNDVPGASKMVARFVIEIERQGILGALKKAGAEHERYADHP